MINAGLKSSLTDMWETPANLFRSLSGEFGGFELDVCAVAENAKCPRFFSPSENGLVQEWVGRCWMNPPYGSQIKHWMKKAYESSLAGALVVCLVPSRTDTGWWHDWAVRGEIRFLRGRLRFGGAKWNAPFASAIVIFRPGRTAEGGK